MEHKQPRLMTPFDDLVTPPALYAMKLMLPYTPAAMQRTLGIYIKFLEFQNTLKYFHGLQSTASSALDSLKDYLAPEEKEMMEQMEMMMNMMEMMKNQPDMPDISDIFGGMPDDIPGDMYGGTPDDTPGDTHGGTSDDIPGGISKTQDADGQKGESENE